MENSTLANHLFRISTLLELKEENPFKIKSYQKAASNIENLPKNAEEIYKDGGRQALEKIEGIGKGISEKIEEFFLTGTSKYLEDLLKEIPGGVVKMLEIQGIGPKLAMRLYKELKIKSTEELLKAAKKGELKKLDGVEDKKAANIIKAIEDFEKMNQKHFLGEMLRYAGSIEDQIKKGRLAAKTLLCGSLRRMKETIGDIDILAESRHPEDLMELFVSLPAVKEVIAKGKTKSSVILENGVNADLRIVKEESFGSASHYFTGSKQHNIKIRKIAISKGLKVSEYGVFKGSKKIAGRTEEELFKALGMQYIPPELREDSGEIEAAQKMSVPDLIELTDIKGDLHMHSDYTDGAASIEEMAVAARNLGYKYIAITDHSKSTKVAGGLTEKEILKQMDEIDRINKKMSGFKILKGSEVDILKDGSLDFDDELLSRLDIVLASVHSNFSMARDEMTKRIIAAMQNKFVSIIGHPTGRILGRRLPFEIDMEKMISEASNTGTVLELNSFPDRLDLNDVHCRLAKEKGAKIAVNTDSHSTKDLLHMKFGIGTARRGWITRKDAINTLPLKDLLTVIGKKRKR